MGRGQQLCAALIKATPLLYYIEIAMMAMPFRSASESQLKKVKYVPCCKTFLKKDLYDIIMTASYSKK